MRYSSVFRPILVTLLMVLISSGHSVWAFYPQQSSLEQSGYLNTFKQSSYYDIVAGTQWADEEQFTKALPLLQRAVERQPNSVMGQFNLAYVALAVAEGMPVGRAREQLLHRSEWAFLRVRDLNPDLAMTYYKLGKIALLREDYLQATHYYEDGVRVHPENYALLFNLAAAYEKLNKTDKAEENYQKSIVANPNFVYAHNNLGLLYEQSNRPEKAEAVYKEALQRVPDYNYARLNLGTLLQSLGRSDEAAQLYREAIQIEPGNAWAHLYLGNTYYRSGQYTQALGAYEAAQQLNPSYPTVYYLLSITLHKLKRDSEALSAGLHYIQLAPNGAFIQETHDMVMTLQQAREQANLNLTQP